MILFRGQSVCFIFVLVFTGPVAPHYKTGFGICLKITVLRTLTWLGMSTETVPALSRKLKVHFFLKVHVLLLPPMGGPSHMHFLVFNYTDYRDG